VGTGGLSLGGIMRRQRRGGVRRVSQGFIARERRVSKRAAGGHAYVIPSRGEIWAPRLAANHLQDLSPQTRSLAP
jgi:hypothetical protein